MKTRDKVADRLLLDATFNSGTLKLSPATFARFASFITGELGIKMPDSKRTLVQTRLQRRIQELSLSSLEEYAEYFFAPGNLEEREHLTNAITTNKTDFFREQEHFSYLLDVALPEMIDPIIRRGERFKIWSAGCSSGEEAYTLAMLLADYARRQIGFDFAILGTDVSTNVLDKALNGIYPESHIRPVPPAFRKQYLLRSHDKKKGLARVVPALRAKASFHQLNFMDDDYGIRDTFHVVFFRNVMIYFDKIAQEAVINKICRNLIPGGYLFVGHSESLAGLSIPVKLVKTSIFRKEG